MATFNPAEAEKAQEDYCNKHNVPHFAPMFCYQCGQNIYTLIKHDGVAPHVSGICVEAAGAHLITGCPHCHASYVD